MKNFLTEKSDWLDLRAWAAPRSSSAQSTCVEENGAAHERRSSHSSHARSREISATSGRAQQNRRITAIIDDKFSLPSPSGLLPPANCPGAEGQRGSEMTIYHFFGNFFETIYSDYLEEIVKNY